MPLLDCCRQEAQKNILKHRDRAVCDGCGNLILGYGNPDDFNNVSREFEARNIPHVSEKIGALYIVAKKRN